MITEQYPDTPKWNLSKSKDTLRVFEKMSNCSSNPRYHLVHLHSGGRFSVTLLKDIDFVIKTRWINLYKMQQLVKHIKAYNSGCYVSSFLFNEEIFYVLKKQNCSLVCADVLLNTHLNQITLINDNSSIIWEIIIS